METAFTPVSSTIGGALIGLSAALLWVANGRIAGVSGILGGLGSAARSDMDWRVIFLAGLVLAPLLSAFAATAPAIAIGAGPTMLIAGGLLVGIGTRLGGGCTSGHGVCGLARLSWRSVAATGLFMVSAAVTVFLIRHVFGV